MLNKFGITLSASFCLIVLVFMIAMPVSVSAASTQAKSQASVLVDLNTASQGELEALKGVGPATAKKIIAARPYKSVDELSKAGLSVKKIEEIKPFVTVGSAPVAPVPSESATKQAPSPAPTKKTVQVPPTTAKAPDSKAKLAPGQLVNINTADAKTLEALPGIGPAKAQAIIEGRPYAKIEDIMKVKGIKQGVFNKIKDSITVK